MKYLRLSFLLAVLLPVLLPAVAFGSCPGFRGGGGMGLGMFGLAGFLVNLIVWIVIIGSVAYLVSYLAKNAGRMGKSKDSTDILKERYAKGEIDKEQFERMKKDLED